jgi:pimeloyl-ACP methyl ester carboxylesterase
MAYARENSLRLKHLVLADMGPQMAKVGAVGLKDDMTSKADKPPSSFTLEDAHAFYRKQWPSLDDASLDRLIQNSLVAGEDGPSTSADAELRTRMYSNRYDRRLSDITTKAAIPEIAYLWESLTRVKCPTLVCRGEQSPILDDEIASRMVRSLPNGQLYVFRDTGHSLPRLRPELFAEMTRLFLRDGALPEQ